MRDLVLTDLEDQNMNWVAKEEHIEVAGRSTK
jgi:hypothetical protein